MPYGAARLPQGNAKQIEVEASLGAAKSEKGRSRSPRTSSGPRTSSSSRRTAPARGSRCRSTWTEDGAYELSTQVAQGSDYGIYTSLLDGKPAGPRLEHEPGADVRRAGRFDGYAPGTYVGLDHQLGWPRLEKGRHTLTFVCTGKNAASTGYTLGVDNVILAKVGAGGGRTRRR